MLCYTFAMQTTSDDLRKQADELDKLARRVRREEFQELRRKGWTLEEIAKVKKITRQRVWKILNDEE